MYSYKERKKAVELYIQYGYRAAAVVRALGYPNRHTLKRWAQEFKTDKELHQGYCRVEKYTEDQKQTAITYYVGHGQCASQTVIAQHYTRFLSINFQRLHLPTLHNSTLA